MLPHTLQRAAWCISLFVASSCIEAQEVSVLKRAQDAGPTPSDEADSICANGGPCVELERHRYPYVDMLFVVDNSASMRGEQAALREQFPRLIQALATGQLSDGTTFPPIEDLHVGVVSTDMGLVGLENNFPGCNTRRHIESGGDDGLLQHTPLANSGCDGVYPPFLEFVQGTHDPVRVSDDLGCIASLGTAGCAFEQPLEAALKALSPAQHVDADGAAVARSPIQFVSPDGQPRWGHGDVPVSEGGNGGFLRSDRDRGPSLISIVLITDEEDCSSAKTSHFKSTNDPADPLSKQPINLRCFYNEQNLFDIDRYIEGYRALRPGDEDRVLFSAIAGVPEDLVDARAGVRWSDAKARNAYYDRILNDQRMLERVTEGSVPGVANIEPSCRRTDSLGETSTAYPPRRIVEVARGLGEQAIVQSICRDDLGPAMDAVLALTASKVERGCAPAGLIRRNAGNIDCDLIWALPKPGSSNTGPFECHERTFLSELEAPEQRTHPHGGRNCKVAQLAVTQSEPPAGVGFYYDDFSDEASRFCGRAGRIAMSAGADAPPSVRVYLDCDANAREL